MRSWRTLQLRSKTWFMMWQGSGGYLQNFKSIHTKLKEIDLRMRRCAPCNWDSSHDRVKRLCTKFQVNTSKNKKFHFGESFFFFLGGGGELDCDQYQILTDPRNGLKNPNMNFGNDRSYRLGGVWWQTDRRQTDRQTDKSNPSVPYDTFACFAGLIIIIVVIIERKNYNDNDNIYTSNYLSGEEHSGCRGGIIELEKEKKKKGKHFCTLIPVSPTPGCRWR